jgi:deoxyinosine 3'endonuclease (endonuclease V)
MVSRVSLASESTPRHTPVPGQDELFGLRTHVRKLWWWLRQRFLRRYLVETDLIDPATIRFVAGVDISFVKSSATDACASLVVCSFPALEVVYARCERVSLSAPYIPGYLAFREAPFLLQLLAQLQTSRPDLAPDLVMVDGNGVLHPNRFGLACHLGVLAGIPTVGVGKSLHCVDGLTREGVRDLARRACTRVGNSSTLVGDSGAVWGAVLRTSQPRSGEFSPLYVSVGHGLSLKSAVEVVRRCCPRHRVPEPIRQADLRSREWLRLSPGGAIS